MSDSDPLFSYEISIEDAESWMDRDIKVSLTTHLTNKTSHSTTIYLSVEEARELEKGIAWYLDKRLYTET